MGGRIEKQYELLEDILNGAAKPRDLPLALLEGITDHFSEERKIGEGGFGTVYKGVLRNQNVAVKKIFVNKYTVDERLFRREVESLMMISDHRNLVRFLGFCSNTARVVEKTGSKETFYPQIVDRLLCFEYISNGSLDKHITDELRGLTWDNRFDIIRGICEGLRYLHEDKSIIHMDLKPANILLDDHMVPKITDFGQSRLAENTHTKGERFFTLGYCAPEYRTYGQTSDRADIYSLGAVIVELVTGTKHIPDITHVLRRWRHRWSKPPTQQEHRQVTKCLEIAVRCREREPKKRPSITDIIRNLKEIESINGPNGQESATQVTNADKFVVQSTEVKEDIIDQTFNNKKAVDEAHLMVVYEPEKYHMHQQKEAVSKLGSMPLQYLKDITDNFSGDRILGTGGFGVVYKGHLHNGEIIAVKKLLHAIQSSQEQFENEVNLLMKLKHQNIVQLVGYCYETEHIHTTFQGKSVFVWNTESLLCLECLPNGSLDKYISDASYGLPWHTRWKVIQGVSYGLQYLHENSNEPIIHLDLKPANILLDANMLPKIADFGLSKLFDQNQTIHTTTVRGTFGYMPQEFLRGIVTPKSDIFSLGVIIMEVITGHRDYPYDIKKSSEGFIEIELNKWKDRLQKEPGYTSLEADCQQIEKCIQIGLICVNNERTKRPTMKKIINMLEGSESMDWYITNEVTSYTSHTKDIA